MRPIGQFFLGILDALNGAPPKPPPAPIFGIEAVCCVCRFWSRSLDPDPHRGVVGKCKRFPATMRPRNGEKTTTVNDWCGEWHPASSSD